MNHSEDSIFSMHARFCSVMANEKRIRIMWLLGQVEEMTVSEIAADLNISLANASQHLRVMRDQKAVLSRKEKQQVYVRLSSRHFFEGCQKIHDGLVQMQLVQTELFKTAEGINRKVPSKMKRKDKSA